MRPVRNSLAILKLLSIFSCCIGLVYLSISPTPSIAQEANTKDTLRYQRVDVPESRIEEFISGLIPIRREEFESLTRETLRMSRTELSFATATYAVELLDESLVNGTATLLRNAGDKVETDGRTSLLTLGGQLSMSKPRWRDERGARPAVVGRQGTIDFVVADPNAKVLDFDWSARGLKNGDVLTFELDFPDVMIQQLQIRIPSDYELHVDQGVVTPDDSTLYSSETTDWRINWSGQNRIRLTLHPQRTEESTGRADYSLQSQYTFLPTGMKLQSELRITPGSDPLSNLRIPVDAPLAITNVTSGEVKLPWITDDDGAIAIELPRRSEIRRTPIAIQISAVAKYPVGSIFKLPRIGAVANWNTETIRCEIRRPIELVDLEMESSRCVGLTEYETHELVEFQLDSESAQLRLVLQREPLQVVANSLTSVVVNNSTATATIETELKPDRGELFDLNFRVADNWVLDETSVEAHAVVASIVDRHEWNNKTRALRIQLRQAATQELPVTLKLRLSMPLSTDFPTLDQFVPLQFPPEIEAAQWLIVDAAPGLELIAENAVNANWQSMESDGLPSWIQDALLLAKGDLFLRIDEETQRVALKRRKNTPPPEVKATTNIQVGHESVIQTVDIAVDPLGNEINKLNVNFSRAISAYEWSLLEQNEESRIVSVRSVEEDQNQPGKRFELSFAKQSEPFQLRLANLNHGLASVINIPLVSIPQAANKGNRVTIFNEPGKTSDVTSSIGLSESTLHSPDIEPKQFAAANSSFTYNEKTLPTPLLTISHGNEEVNAAVAIWRCDISSFYTERGRPRHRTDFFLQQDNANRFECSLPVGFALEKVEVDGESLSPQPRLVDGKVTIPITGENRYPCVSLRYVQPQQTLSLIDWIQPPIPECETQPLQTTWQIWLPQDFRAFADGQQATEDATWLTRLVGPLGDDASNLLNPLRRWARRRFSANDDQAAVIHSQLQWRLSNQWSFPSRIGQVNATGGDLSLLDEPENWGRRFEDIEADLSRLSQFELYVDLPELLRLGIFPETLLPPTRQTSFFQKQGLDRLVQSGLGVIVDGHRALITSASEVQTQTTNIEPFDGITIKGTLLAFPTSRLVRVKDWNANRERKLWNHSSDELELGLLRGGWTSYRHAVDELQPLKIYHRDTVIAFMSAAFLIGFGIGWWLFQQNRRRWFRVFCLGFFIGLLLPQPGATLVVAFAWGVVASGLFRHVTQRPRPLRYFADASTQLHKPRAASWLLAFAIVPICEQALQSQELSPSERQVFFPVDKSSNPTDTVYLSPQLLGTLKSNSGSSNRLPDYLFTSASYTGVWPDRSFESITLQARFKVTSFVSSSRVALPQFGSKVRMNGKSIKLDRSPAKVEYNNAEQPFLTILRPGDYEISIELSVPIESELDDRFFKFPTPTISHSELRMDVPRDLRAAAVPSAMAEPNIDLQRGMLTCQLGPSSELHVRAAFPAPVTNERRGVDQFVLIRLSDDVAEVETRFRSNDEQTQPSLRLKVDPRLTPLFEKVSASDWNPTEQELRVNASVMGTDYGPKFKLDKAIQSGSFVLPELKPLETRVRKRLIAIESTTRVNVDFDPREASLISEVQFFEAWNGLTDATRTYLSSDANQSVTLNLEKPVPSMNWTSETKYFFLRPSKQTKQTRPDGSAIYFEFEADIKPSEGTEQDLNATIIRLSVPPAMKVERVGAKLNGDVPQGLRWRITQESNLTIFFPTQTIISAEDLLALSVQGNLRSDQDTSQGLPLILPSDTGVEKVNVSQRITLYQSTDVEVDIVSPETMEPNDDATNSVVRNGYRNLGSWQWESSDDIRESYASAFNVVAREVIRNVQATLTTKLIYDDATTSWRADFNAVLASEQGVDSISFDVPASITQSLPDAFEGNERLRVEEVREAPGTGRRIITVWLPESDSKRRTITLTADINQIGTVAPNVKPLNATLQQHFVELPKRSLDSYFEWKTTGLASVEGSDERFVVDDARFEFSAELEVQPASFKPEVFLLDTLIQWTSAMRYSAISLFDLRPPESPSCFLELPINAQLVQAYVDDHRIRTEKVSEAQSGNRWRLDLGAAPWPQRVRIMYVGTCDVGLDGTVALNGPRLATVGTGSVIPVKNELWTVFGAEDVERPQVLTESDRIISAVERDNIVLTSFNELWQEAKTLVSERPVEEQNVNRRLWAERLSPLVERVERELVADDNPEYQAFLQLLSDYNSHVGDSFPTISQRSPQPQDLWNESQRVFGERIVCSSAPSVDGDLPELRLRYDNTKRGVAPIRYLFAAVFLLCPFVLPSWKPFREVVNWSDRFPHLVLGIIGVVWWFVLVPSIFGIFLAIVSIAMWTIGALRQRRLVLPQ